MTPEQQLRKYLPYYLGSGLKFERLVRVNDKDQESIKILNGLYVDINTWLIDLWERKYNVIYCKPIVRLLSDLNKPIKVEGYNDGKEFVPIKDVTLGIDEFKHQLDGYCFRKGNVWYRSEQLDLWQIEKLISWHFWPFDQSLFETGYLKAIEHGA